MKVYSIGREGGCDIVIHDNTDVISRRHATLNVLPSGKMTIVDQSHNGTYVNGIRISPNVPVPVTRKDNVSLAHVARLDWNLVPKPVSPMRYALYAFIGLIVVAGCIWGYKSLNPVKPEQEKNILVTDSLSKEKTDTVKDKAATEKAEKAEKADSEKQKESDKETAKKKEKKVKGNTVKEKSGSSEKKKEDNKNKEEKKETGGRADY